MAFEALIEAYSLSQPNYPLLLVSLLTFIFGYIEYMYSFALALREKKGPFPLWMHTFYFAHDLTWCIRLFFAASTYDWNWFLTGTSLALLIWNGFEIFNLSMAIMVERDDIWGGKRAKDGKKIPISVMVPLLDITQQIVGSLCMVNLLIVFTGEDFVFEWFLFTNMIMAWGPGKLWQTREDRRGCSVGLAWVIVIATINSFNPWSMWVLAMPEKFGGFWYYASGVLFTGFALGNVRTVLNLKGKKWEKGDKSLIW